MRNSHWQLIGVDQFEEWRSVLACCSEWDTYALSEYHVAAQQMQGGEPLLFMFRKGDRIAALPFLLRDIEKTEWNQDENFKDATSVYGYPGVLCSGEGEGSSGRGGFRKAFIEALTQALSSLSCVSLFVRLNPLLNTEWLLEDGCETKTLSSTVAVDLSKPNRVQVAAMSKGHRYDIRKALSQGVSAFWDQANNRLDEFVSVYHETMDRVAADRSYYFSRRYFERLKQDLGASMRLYVATRGSEMVAASLFLFSENIVQYHLSGTPKDRLRLSGAKVILNQVRKDATREGRRWLHLGGGVGSKDDALFRFKAGFSKTRFVFKAARLVVNASAYRKLCLRRSAWVDNQGLRIIDPEYFPQYRAPVG